MFNSIAFDVVIGLVFIYLLYSLFVTIIGEIIMTKLNIRAKLLLKAVERMLNDGYIDAKGQPVAQPAIKAQATPAPTDAASPPASPPIASSNLKLVAPPNLQVKHSQNASRFGLLKLKVESGFVNSLADKFYKQPAIKYLAKTDKDIPSYFSNETFADTVINLLKRDASADNVFDKIHDSLANELPELPIDNGTRVHLCNLFIASTKTDGTPAVDGTANIDKTQTIAQFKTSLSKWYDETMDRTSGWYKEHLRLILLILGFVIAVCFNVDSIKIAKLLSTDKDARDKMVKMGIATAKDSARYQQFVDSKGDTIHSQSILDTSYARVNHDLEAANKILGIGWDFDQILKSDSLVFYSKDTLKYLDSIRFLRQYTAQIRLPETIRTKPGLKNDSIALKLIKVKLSGPDTSYLSNAFAIESLNQESLDTLVRLLSKVNLHFLDTVNIISNYDALCRLKESLKRDVKFINHKLDSIAVRQKENAIDTAKTLINIQIANAESKNIDALKKDLIKGKDKDSILKVQQKVYRLNLQIDSISMPKDSLSDLAHASDSITNHYFFTITGFRAYKSSIHVYGKRHLTPCEKIFVFFDRLRSIPSLIGFLITALAVSLGAPFWFDLLNKLVSIRGAGVKPEEKKPPKSTTTNP